MALGYISIYHMIKNNIYKIRSTILTILTVVYGLLGVAIWAAPDRADGRRLSSAEAPANRNGLGPTILVEPRAEAVTEGGTVSLSVVAEGDSPLAYQWRRNGEEIGDGTNSVLTITNAQSAHNGVYQVEVRSSEGATTSTNVALTVYNPLDSLFDTGLHVGGTSAILAIDFQSDQRAVVGTLRQGQYVPAGFVRFDPNGLIDRTFNTGLGANLSVYAVAVLPDNKVLVGGDFTEISNVRCRRIARVNEDGSLDLSFPTGRVPNWEVRALAVQTDGKILVGGFFTTYDDQAHGGIVRIDPNGELDSSFDPGLGANSGVEALALQPDGRIVVGGWFTDFNGFPVAYLIRVNTDGSRDATFDLGAGPNQEVTTVKVQADGKILIGGAFTEINHLPAHHLARLNTDGSLDGTFRSGTGADDWLFALAEQADGKILIGGKFQSYDGHFCPRFARLNTDGTWDAGYTLGSGVSDQVNVIAIRDQVAYLGGHFESINGFARRHFALIHLAPPPHYVPLIKFGPRNTSVPLNGSVRFEVSAAGYPWPKYQWQHEGTNLVGATNAVLSLSSLRTNQAGVYSVAVSNEIGTTNWTVSLMVTGAPPQLLSQSKSQYVNEGTELTLSATATGFPAPSYQWQKDGVELLFETNASLRWSRIMVAQSGSYSVVCSNAFGLVASEPMILCVRQRPLDPYFKVNLEDFGSVEAIVLQPQDQKILIGGRFHSVNGTSCRSIARLDANGRLDPTFRSETGFDNDIFALALQPDRKILCVGTFHTAGGKPHFGLARLNPDGSVDESFAWSPGMEGTFMSVQLQKDNKILIGGRLDDRFLPPFHHLLRLFPDGTLDPTFDDHFCLRDYVYHLAIQMDDKILAGGFYPLMRLSDNGNPDSSFNGVEGSRIRTLQLQEDGKILAASLNDEYVATPFNFARFNSDGSYDRSYVPDIKPAQGVSTLLLQPDGKIVLAGFPDLRNIGRISRLLRLNPDGSADASFNSGSQINGEVYSMVQTADGSILVGGMFRSVDDVPRFNLARFNPEFAIDYSPRIEISPSQQTATVNEDVVFTATITHFPTDSLQWKHDGQEILGATNLTLTLGQVQPEQAGGYQIVGYHTTGEVTSEVAFLEVRIPAPVNTAPVLAPISDETVEEGVTMRLAISAMDSDRPAQRLTYALELAPQGSEIDSQSGTFSWMPTEVQGPSTNLIQVRVTDDGQPPLADVRSFTIVGGGARPV